MIEVFISILSRSNSPFSTMYTYSLVNYSLINYNKGSTLSNLKLLAIKLIPTSPLRHLANIFNNKLMYRKLS